jgi:hypothetical protein
LLLAAPGIAPPVMSSTTGDTFYFNTTPSTFNEAEEGCKKGGGHLAAYTSVDEQAEVEQVGFSTATWPPVLHLLQLLTNARL